MSDDAVTVKVVLLLRNNGETYALCVYVCVSVFFSRPSSGVEREQSYLARIKNVQRGGAGERRKIISGRRKVFPEVDRREETIRR